VDVDRSIQDGGRLRTVDGVEQLVARQDATGRTDQDRQQAKLDRSQRDEILSSADLVPLEIDAQVAVEELRWTCPRTSSVRL
jgi:hypothetical protein